MPSLKALRRRIRTVHNTKLITRAMRSVAASKMRRTQERRDSIRPYANRLQRLVANIVRSVGGEHQPLMRMRDTGKRMVVLFTSDRGLCGAFNNSIIRFTEDYLKSFSQQEYDLCLIGRKGIVHFQKRGYPIAEKFTEFKGNVDLDRILAIARYLKTAFLEQNYNRVELIYNQAITAMSYRPKRELFLPLQEEELMRGLEESGAREHRLDYIFEPDPQTLLSEFLPKFVETKIFYVFVDAFAAEHQARMIAMTNANSNCEELLENLTLQMNKARQTTITKELLEIVGGAEALSG